MAQGSNSVGTQLAFDYSVFDQDTTTFLQETEDKIVGRTQRWIKDTGKDLLEAKMRIGHGHFVDWIRARFDMSEDTAQNLMNVARNFGEIPNGSVFADRALYLLSRKSTPEDARQEAKDRAVSGEEITFVVATEIVETKKALKLEQEARIEAERKAETFEQQYIWSQAETELTKSENEGLKQELEKRSTPEMQEDHTQWEKEARKDQERTLREERQKLEEHYAKRDQERQFKAENTIHGLISHGVKSMAETELTIDHIASAGMFQAVQQLGGRHLDSLLAQADSLSEALDRMRVKLTQGDYIALTDGSIINAE